MYDCTIAIYIFIDLVGELLISFYDVTFVPYHGSFYTTFLKYFGRGKDRHIA